MLRSTIARMVGFCTAHSIYVLIIAGVITFLSGSYTVNHFAINTDINQLIEPGLPWRQRELALETAFPGRSDFILAVIDAPTPELATQATTALLQRLREHPELFHSIRQQGGGEFFARNGLLFTPTEELEQTAKG